MKSEVSRMEERAMTAAASNKRGREKRRVSGRSNGESIGSDVGPWMAE